MLGLMIGVSILTLLNLSVTYLIWDYLRKTDTSENRSVLPLLGINNSRQSNGKMKPKIRDDYAAWRKENERD